MQLVRNPQPLQLTELLHLERCDCSDDSRRERESTRNDATDLNRGLERAASHLGAKRLKKRVTCLSYAPREHDDVRIEDVEQVCHAGAEEVRRLADDFSCYRITSLGCLVNYLRCDFPLVTVNHAHQNRLAFVAAQGFAGSLG